MRSTRTTRCLLSRGVRVTDCMPVKLAIWRQRQLRWRCPFRFQKISLLIVAITFSASGHLSRAFVGAPGGAGSPSAPQGQARDHSWRNGPSIQSGPIRYCRALGSNCESK